MCIPNCPIVLLFELQFLMFRREEGLWLWLGNNERVRCYIELRINFKGGHTRLRIHIIVNSCVLGLEQFQAPASLGGASEVGEMRESATQTSLDMSGQVWTCLDKSGST